MSYKIVDENSIISLADAIRLKGGTSASLVFPNGFVSAIEDISSGSDTEDRIIDRTISGVYENSRLTQIGSYAFYGCYSLTTVSFPNVTSIGNSAFYGCYSLTTVSFPNVTSIGNYAFRVCYNLVSTFFLASSVVSLGTSAFYGTPIGGSTTSTGGVYGSIFVPASLYNSYITATNWSLYSARIVSV